MIDSVDKAYTSWLGEWWDSFMEYWVNIQQSEHIINKLRLEMEIAGMINVAKLRASKVGYMFWDKPKRGISNFINTDNCIINDVRGWLEENENEAYKRSLEEWLLPNSLKTLSSKLCAPKLKRLIPASKNPSSERLSKLAGSISSVISAPY